MLGCKYEYSMADEKTGEGINRYMLGCKYDTAHCMQCDWLELIDTCWDVNKGKGTYVGRRGYEN